MCEFESFIFWHVRMDSKIILATFKITNVGSFFVIFCYIISWPKKLYDFSCYMKYFKLLFSFCLLLFPPQYTVNKQNLSHNVFILQYWNQNKNFFYLKDPNDGSERIWEVKNAEKAAFTISWTKWPHALALDMPKKTPPKWIRILESIHINNSLKLSNVTHQGWNALSNRATISV